MNRRPWLYVCQTKVPVSAKDTQTILDIVLVFVPCTWTHCCFFFPQLSLTVRHSSLWLLIYIKYVTVWIHATHSICIFYLHAWLIVQLYWLFLNFKTFHWHAFIRTTLLPTFEEMLIPSMVYLLSSCQSSLQLGICHKIKLEIWLQAL